MNEKTLDREMELAQQLVDSEVAKVSAKANVQNPKGRCLYCHEVLDPDLSFCPPEAPGLPGCRDDYEAEMAASRRNGAFRRI